MAQKTRAASRAMVATACQTNFISAPVWTLIAETKNEMFRYRVEDFITFVESKKFKLSLFEEESFVEGLAISFNEFVKQRSVKKREWIKNVLSEFSEVPSEEEYELEMIYDVINKISSVQLKVLHNFTEKRIQVIETEDQILVTPEEHSALKVLESFGLVILTSKSTLESTKVENVNFWDNSSSYVLTDESYNPFIPKKEKKPAQYIKSKTTAGLTIFGQKFIKFVLE